MNSFWWGFGLYVSTSILRVGRVDDVIMLGFSNFAAHECRDVENFLTALGLGGELWGTLWVLLLCACRVIIPSIFSKKFEKIFWPILWGAGAKNSNFSIFCGEPDFDLGGFRGLFWGVCVRWGWINV